MRVLATISDENFSTLRTRWKAFEKEAERIGAIGTSCEDDLTAAGRVLEIDWVSGRLSRSVAVSMPTGIVERSGGFAVCGHNRCFLLDDELRLLRDWQHPWFNNLHALCAIPKGWAVAASGIDSVLFMNERFEPEGHWSAIDHGFSHDPYGRVRCVDMRAAHHAILYPTLMHTTHVNGLCWVEEETSLYVTLFHQGQVVSIGRDGEPAPVVSGLSAPHSVQRLPGDRIGVADTRRNRILVWPRSRPETARAIAFPTDWLQDFRHLVGAGREGWLVADSGNHRILEADADGEILREFVYDPEWRIHQLLVVEPAAPARP